jgi:predicted metal-dependent HD superfamily phosphohydrolase
MKNSRLTPALQFASEYLSAHLPPELKYHNYQHTFNEVLPAVSRMAEVMGISPRERELLEVAAVYHDIGFTQAAQDHEQIGVALAHSQLPGFGFSQAEIQVIQGLILATVLPQRPKTLLEEIMADADLDILGCPNFLQRNEDLRQEMELAGAVYTDEEWYSQQVKFVENHAYFTPAARDYRDALKQQNLSEIRQRLVEVVRPVP